MAWLPVRVTVIEKNPEERAGGRLNVLVKHVQGGRFRFDTGPSLLLLPEIYRGFFEGEKRLRGIESDVSAGVASWGRIERLTAGARRRKKWFFDSLSTHAQGEVNR